MFVVAILAGGKGTRLWPFSNRYHPKPFIEVDNGITLYSETLERIKSLNPDKIVCISNEKYKNFTKSSLVDEYIFEKDGKNTAAAILFTSTILERIFGADTVVLFVPADHWIKDKKEFNRTALEAANLAKKGNIITLGIKPKYPENGFGYIIHNNGKVSRFEEKPKVKRAEELINSGALWNSGIFCMSCKTINEEASKHCFELVQKKDQIQIEIRSNEIYVDYKDFPDISIDKAIMEKSERLLVIPADMGWDDIGSLTSFFNLKKTKNLISQENGNEIEGKGITIDCENLSISTNKNFIAAIGISDQFIVSKDNTILIVNKKNVQDVKKIKQEEIADMLEFEKVYRPWGTYQIIEKGPNFLVKRIEVHPGGALSLQLHNHRDEHWIITKGSPLVVIGDKTIETKENQQLFIPKKIKHRMINKTNETVTFIEVQFGNVLEESDIVRLEDNYGRN